ncbi:L-idonate 5-dehydrogenase [Pseudovibrio sp. Tun.PSC04-5.I4]|uniref:L-idonate 5-dehydrogenase n=1 Tax=Pseudovibrio sp. Tun.PSC04-5.I4 TaxID=1798213 RepID=UPI000885B902|nr:L-idonate 5-dehydrogenase [Pseudovibrio sp. Tun.PSC04-5.I4]SDQ21676.1 L-idonate 5-dehydrogenase [Pseudovibrio sp. Tun.PSC04-5.I4]
MTDARTMLSFSIETETKKGVIEQPVPVPGPGEVLIKMSVVGICGSDIHYYRSAACGAFQIREAFTPGHEACGVVEALGDGVTGLEVGQLSAINPSRTCGECSHCLDGDNHLCTNNGFMGSASRFPHSQGMMKEYFLVKQGQCYPVPDETPVEQLACAEPFSVALHALQRAGNLFGKRVLIVGGGTIGQLAAIGAKLAGASFVALSDPTEHARTVAQQVGVDVSVDSLLPLDQKLDTLGLFDVCLEAAGAEPALADCIELLKRKGVIVQIGTLPIMQGRANFNAIMAKELDYRGSFRFHQEFRHAVELIVSGKVDLSPILSGSYPLSQASKAFDRAVEGGTATKLTVLAER